MSSLKIIRIALWSLIAVIVAAMSFTLFMGSKPQNMVTAELGAPFKLVDHNGAPITDSVFDDGPVAMFFGFTHCPEVCPTTMFEMSGWMEQLGEDGEALKGVFVTIDPERDTPALMKNYVTNLSDRFTGITGPKEDVEAMARSWRVYFKRQELDDGDYTMDHTASIFLLKPGGKFFGTIAWGENPETAVEKMKRLVAAS